MIPSQCPSEAPVQKGLKMIFNFLRNFFETDAGIEGMASEYCAPIVNPATGLPMSGCGIGGVDVGGSPFGIDIHCNDCGFDFNPWD